MRTVTRDEPGGNLVFLLLLLLLLLLCAACRSTEPVPAPVVRTENSTMQITLTVEGGPEIHGALDDTPPARALLGQLPLTLQLEDFHGSERIAYLPERLDTAGAPDAQTEVEAGDIAYYAPWGNLALFYRAGATYTGGLVRLGRLEPGAADRLAALDRETRVTITRS